MHRQASRARGSSTAPATFAICSVRENKTNRRLLGIHPGRTRIYNDIHDHMWFRGSNCEGNTVFKAWQGTSPAGPDSGNHLFRTLHNT